MAEKFDNLYDLHNHLVFGIDDGARTPEDTIHMLEDAAANRIKVIVATPHGVPQAHWTKFEENYAAAAAMADEYGIKLLRGIEYNARNLAENQSLETLGGAAAGVVLMDFRIPNLPPEFQLCVDRVFNANHTLVIAHPERTFPPEALDKLSQLFDNGVIYQVTAGSLLGHFGTAECKMAWKFLEWGWAKFVASDAHDVKSRSNCLLEAYNLIARRWGTEAALTLQENARRAVENPEAGFAAVKKPAIWKRIFHC